jgi:hypothetical protein
MKAEVVDEDDEAADAEDVELAVAALPLAVEVTAEVEAEAEAAADTAPEAIAAVAAVVAAAIAALAEASASAGGGNRKCGLASGTAGGCTGLENGDKPDRKFCGSEAMKPVDTTTPGVEGRIGVCGCASGTKEEAGKR